MRVLLTGAGGFIGSHLCRLLARDGDDAIAVVRGSPARLSDLPSLRIAALDLDDREGVDRLLKDVRPDVTVHLAWYADPADYLTSPKNVDCQRITCAFAESVFASGCRRLVAAGTCLEYAASNRPRAEAHPVDPTSLYASCKHAAWRVCRDLARAHGGSLAWARIFHLHGPGEHPARLVPSVARSLRRGQPVALSSGTQVRDHLHVADVASALACLVRSDVNEPVNVCSGTPVTLREVVETVGDILGRRDLLQFGARADDADAATYLVGDAGRLRTLGWRPTFSNLRDGLAYLAEEAKP